MKDSDKTENGEIKAPLFDNGDFVYETEYISERSGLRTGRRRGKRMLIALLAVCAAVLAMLIIRLPRSSERAEDIPEGGTAEAFGVQAPANPDWSWFRGGNIRYDNEPFLVFSGDVEVVEADGAEIPMWVCRLKIQETTGIGFVPQRIEQYEYRSESDYTKSVFSADSLWKLGVRKRHDGGRHPRLRLSDLRYGSGRKDSHLPHIYRSEEGAEDGNRRDPRGRRGGQRFRSSCQ